MEDMLHHTQAVRRGAPNTFVVGDMPYMSYQPSIETAIRNAGRFMAEAGCDAVKLEGGTEMCDHVRAMVEAGIPTVGHLGLTPQSVSALGGYKVQGKLADRAKQIIDSAKALEEAGAFMMVLEIVPDRVCKLITERAENCIIISVGSGPHAHGQFLVFNDMFGLYPNFKPRMAKVYGNAGEVILNGLKQYVHEVTTRAFPQRENFFIISDEEYKRLLEMLK
jgi:3-methyl-2-oxobutanoate hydroxymethyltransferase